MTRNDWIHQTAMRMLAADPELDADFVADTCVEVAAAIHTKAPFTSVEHNASGPPEGCPACKEAK